MWPWPLASWRSPTVPRTRVGPQERVEQHILVPPGVEEGAADGSLELEAALLGDTPRRRVLLDDDQVDAVELLVREDPVHDEVDRFRHVAVPGGPVAVELVRQLQCVPVADRPEELDMPDDLLAPSRMTRVPSSFCQKPCSAKARLYAGSERTPSGKYAPRFRMSTCAVYSVSKSDSRTGRRWTRSP